MEPLVIIAIIALIIVAVVVARLRRRERHRGKSDAGDTVGGILDAIADIFD